MVGLTGFVLAIAGTAIACIALLLPPQIAPAPGLGQPVWTEINWPFPIDQWGTGRAYACAAADCGSAVTVYLRTKLGFCNCTTGVADDEELERVSDLEFAGRQPMRRGDGRPVNVHWMKGRSRSYAIGDRTVPAKSLLAIAFNDRCDAIAATALIGGDRPETFEPVVLEFLNSEVVKGWAEQALGI